MNNYTTVEADPQGAASFLRALKQKAPEVTVYNRAEQHTGNWFKRGTEEVQERLGRPSLWTNPSIVGKGFDYETLAGVNIGGNQPVIDDIYVDDRIVTSMKTIDTQARMYQYPDEVYRRGKDCVNAFETFKGVKTKDGYELPLDQVKGFYLEIAVRDDLLPWQREELERLQAYGEEKGVRVVIAEVA